MDPADFDFTKSIYSYGLSVAELCVEYDRVMRLDWMVVQWITLHSLLNFHDGENLDATVLESATTCRQIFKTTSTSNSPPLFIGTHVKRRDCISVSILTLQPLFLCQRRSGLVVSLYFCDCLTFDEFWRRASDSLVLIALRFLFLSVPHMLVSFCTLIVLYKSTLYDALDVCCHTKLLTKPKMPCRCPKYSLWGSQNFLSEVDFTLSRKPYLSFCQYW